MTTLLLFAGGLLALLIGASALVRGASRLALRLGLSPLVVGLTVVSMGTGAPEMAVAGSAVLAGQTGLAVGSVVGSNIVNVLLILGLAALITPLAVHRQVIRQEVPIMIGAAVLMIVLGLDGAFGGFDSALLLGLLVAYIAFVVRQSRREAASAPDHEFRAGQPGPPPVGVQVEWQSHIDSRATGAGRVFERPHDARSDRDDAAATPPRRHDRARRRVRDAIGLVERQPRIERGIAGRRESGRMRQRCECDAALAQVLQRTPVERETGRRRLECRGQRSNRRPHVPQRKRRGHVRVLDGASMASQPGPDRLRRSREAQRDEARMTEQSDHPRIEGAEHEPVAGRKQGRWRTLFGALAKVAAAEHHRAEVAHVVGCERVPAGKPHFDRRAARGMEPVQARGQGRRVVRDQQVVRPQQIDEACPREMAEPPARVDREQPRVRRTLHRLVRCNQAATPRFGSAATMASISSRAAICGRFRLARSAPGTARACSGVSMSPGSIDSMRTPVPDNSSSQMRDKCASAALLAP